VWRKTDKWRPARLGTASRGGGVQNSETGEIGFAKSQFPYREKIASDLAARIGVCVPRVELDHVEGDASWHAISIVHGKESIDLTLLRERLAAHFNSPVVQDALKQASGLLALHAWIATQDLKDEHLMVAVDSAGAYNVAAIDFAFSLDWQNPDGGPVQPPAFPSLVANIDKTVLNTAVERIEAMSDEDIRAIVNPIPSDLAGVAEKERLTNGLIGRRGKIRQALTNQGWLP
jgi:hypothetical protein